MSSLLLGREMGETKQLGCHRDATKIFTRSLRRIVRDAKNYSQEAESGSFNRDEQARGRRDRSRLKRGESYVLTLDRN